MPMSRVGDSRQETTQVTHRIRRATVRALVRCTGCAGLHLRFDPPHILTSRKPQYAVRDMIAR
jgi:hypothetical protein